MIRFVSIKDIDSYIVGNSSFRTTKHLRQGALMLRTAPSVTKVDYSRVAPSLVKCQVLDLSAL